MLPQNCNLTALCALCVTVFVLFSAIILYSAQIAKVNTDKNSVILNQILSITDEYQHQLNLHLDLALYMLLPNETRLNTFNFEKIQYIQDQLQDAQFDLSFAPAMLVLVSDSNALLNETLASFTSNVSQSSSLSLRQSTLLLNMRTLVLEFVAATSGSIHAVSSQISTTTLQIIFIQIASLVLMLPLALLLVLTLQEKMRLLIEAYELSVEQKTEIESSLNVKNEFLNVMSHELRTPLNGVLGMLELLLESETQIDRRNNLSVAVWSAESLLLIITNILDFQSLSTSLTVPKLDPVSLFSLAAELFALFEPVMHSKSLHFELVMFPLDQLPHHVLTDIYWLRQVLINLLSNAHKFTPSGGYVLVCFSIIGESESDDVKSLSVVARKSSLPVVSDSKVDITRSWSTINGLAASLSRGTNFFRDQKAAQKVAYAVARAAALKLSFDEQMSNNPANSSSTSADVNEVVIELGDTHQHRSPHRTPLVKVRIEITDTALVPGVGMSPASLQQLFEVFGQSDQSLGREFGGVGLGLAIAFKLTKRLKGSLSVRSELGVGSTFTFDLPLDVSIDNPIDPASLQIFNHSGLDGQLAIIQAENHLMSELKPMSSLSHQSESTGALTSAIINNATHSRHNSVRMVTFNPVARVQISNSSCDEFTNEAHEFTTGQSPAAPIVENSPLSGASPEAGLPRPQSHMRLSALGLNYPEVITTTPSAVMVVSPAPSGGGVGNPLPKKPALAPEKSSPLPKYTPRVTTTAASSGKISVRPLQQSPALIRPHSMNARAFSISISPPGATREASAANAVELVLTPGPPKHQRRSSALATPSGRSSVLVPRAIVAYSSPAQSPNTAIVVDASVPSTAVVEVVSVEVKTIHQQATFVSSQQRYSSHSSHLRISDNSMLDSNPELSPNSIALYRPAKQASISPLLSPQLQNSSDMPADATDDGKVISQHDNDSGGKNSGPCSSPRGILRIGSLQAVRPFCPAIHSYEPAPLIVHSPSVKMPEPSASTTEITMTHSDFESNVHVVAQPITAARTSSPAAQLIAVGVSGAANMAIESPNLSSKSGIVLSTLLPNQIAHVVSPALLRIASTPATRRGTFSQGSGDELSGVKRPLHVLVVEDNLVNQRFALAILAKLGHTAQLAEDGLLGVNLWCRSVGLAEISLSDVAGDVADAGVWGLEEKMSGTRITPLLAQVVVEGGGTIAPLSTAGSPPLSRGVPGATSSVRLPLPVPRHLRDLAVPTGTASVPHRTPLQVHRVLPTIPALAMTDITMSSISSGTGIVLGDGRPTQRFDMCLMDISMPVMDGVIAATMIRRLERQHGWHAEDSSSGSFLPIIAVTANTEGEYREKCLACGMQDYICKPYKKADLMAKMNIYS